MHGLIETRQPSTVSIYLAPTWTVYIVGAGIQISGVGGTYPGCVVILLWDCGRGCYVSVTSVTVGFRYGV